jgi:hypothetical protein
MGIDEIRQVVRTNVESILERYLIHSPAMDEKTLSLLHLGTVQYDNDHRSKPTGSLKQSLTIITHPVSTEHPEHYLYALNVVHCIGDSPITSVQQFQNYLQQTSETVISYPGYQHLDAQEVQQHLRLSIASAAKMIERNDFDHNQSISGRKDSAEVMEHVR